MPDITLNSKKSELQISSEYDFISSMEKLIHIITSNIEVEIDDCLINKHNQKFMIIKTEFVSNDILRIYFSQ